MENLTWRDCADLYKTSNNETLSRMMGGMASALRSGSEITFIDWGKDWWNTALENLEIARILDNLVISEQWNQLDSELYKNEERIIKEIYDLFKRIL